MKLFSGLLATAVLVAAGLQSVPLRNEDNRRRRQEVYDTVFAAVQQQRFDANVIDRPGELSSPYYLQTKTIGEAPREFTRPDPSSAWS
jgi:hypothetical protein